MLGFFLPDDLIRGSLQGLDNKSIPFNGNNLHQFTAAKLKENTYLDNFFQSMLVYFRDKKQPPDSIIKLKLKELLLNIVYNCDDQLLVSYLKYIHQNSNSSLTHIMETNFCFIHKHWKLCSLVTIFIYRNMTTIYTDVIFKVSHLHKSYLRKLIQKNNLNETVPLTTIKTKHC